MRNPASLDGCRHDQLERQGGSDEEGVFFLQDLGRHPVQRTLFIDRMANDEGRRKLIIARGRPSIHRSAECRRPLQRARRVNRSGETPPRPCSCAEVSHAIHDAQSSVEGAMTGNC